MREMQKGIIGAIIIFLTLILLVAAGWWAFPSVVAAMPGRLKNVLPVEIIQAASTPLPTALPAPALRSQTAVSIPTMALPTPTLAPTYTVEPSPTRLEAAPDIEGENEGTVAGIPTAVPTLTPTPTPTTIPLPVTVQIEGLQIIPQKFNNCGPANLTINLSHLGYDVDQLAVAAELRPVYEDRNVSPAELVDYVNNQTPFRAAAYSGGDLTLLKTLLAQGIPVVIEKGLVPSEWEGWMGHYLTLTGYDDASAEFTTLDTFLGPWDSSGLRETYDFIDEHWRHFNYTFYIVYAPEQEVLIADIIGDDKLDASLMWFYSAQRAQSDSEARPDDPFAWFNLGTSLTHLGRLTGDSLYYENAAAAFDQARRLGLPWRMLWYQFQPYEAYLANGRIEDVMTLANATLSGAGGQEEAFYYRGLAYLQEGNEAQARSDFEVALQRNPTFIAAQEALDSLQ